VAALILDDLVEQSIIEKRRAWGVDQHDEVWDGVYVMPPSANNDHGYRVSSLCAAFVNTIEPTGLGKVYDAPNISDRDHPWKHNYRTPDIGVVLNGSTAVDCGTHFVGAVDFLVEIVSKGDRSYEKIDFYAQLGVRELLILDRDPWAIKLYRHDSQRLVEIADLRPGDGRSAVSEVLPLSFSLETGDPSPVMVVTGREKVWRI